MVGESYVEVSEDLATEKIEELLSVSQQDRYIYTTSEFFSAHL